MKQEISKASFDKTKEEGGNFYKTLGKVYCPYFKEEVSFNAKGLEHLKFKQKNFARSLSDQYIRFKILKFAPEVLKLTKTVQGVSEQKVFELIRSNQRNEHKMVNAIYYEFVAILNRTRVRVVVKQVDGAPKYFWSIIPFWKINKEKGKRKLHYGSPEHD